MKPMNRREMGLALSAFAALAALPAEAQATAEATAPVLAHSRLFAFADLPARTAPNGTITRSVMQGNLATGEFVEVHETTLPVGEMPHPPHRHTHSEMLLVREGRLQVVSDGQEGVVGPGDVIFTASAVLHSLKNIGDVPSTYFVVAVGKQKVIA